MTDNSDIELFSIKVDASALVFYCRPGYEKDAADEIAALTAVNEWFGYPNIKINLGFFTFHFYEQTHATEFAHSVSVDTLVFCRQYFLRYATLENLPKTDRVSSVLQALDCINDDDKFTAKSISGLGSVSVDYPDTESGKQVAKFAKKFTVPLRQTLRKKGDVSTKENLAKPMLHVFFTDFSQCFVGVSQSKNRSLYHNGIHRLKFPQDAPSRSTLKLEEALIDLVPEAHRETFLRHGARAVDLGACPGGWTYQLVKHQVYVEAVDNGAMDESLMRTGLVDYAAADGFKYRPAYGTVDVVVCDMIERPDRVADLITQWLVNKYAHSAIFNLKLPMKLRYETVRTILQKMESQLQQSSKGSYVIRCKHLYHDRDEVTVSVLPA